MKSRVIQDDPDDGRPPAGPPPAAASVPVRRGSLKRLLAWFFRRNSRTNTS